MSSDVRAELTLAKAQITAMQREKEGLMRELVAYRSMREKEDMPFLVTIAAALLSNPGFVNRDNDGVDITEVVDNAHTMLRGLRAPFK